MNVPLYYHSLKYLMISYAKSKAVPGAIDVIMLFSITTFSLIAFAFFKSIISSKEVIISLLVKRFYANKVFTT